MAIKVIGAGMGRTGTASMKKALEDLGFNKCYHMLELMADPYRVVHWENISQQKPTDWDAWMEGYQAAVDFPTCLYYKEMMEYYPDAKVVLTVRDPEKWFESASNTIFTMRPKAWQWAMMYFIGIFSRKVRYTIRVGKTGMRTIGELFERNELKKETAIRVFNAHNEEVKRTVPADRLLVYSVKEGWEPLCEFLGVPVPEHSFPHLNQRADFKKNIAKRVQTGSVKVEDTVNSEQ